MSCQIYHLMRKGEFTHFISGGALGVDMDFAEIVIGLRHNTFDNITLDIAVPCPNQQKLLTSYLRIGMVKTRAELLTQSIMLRKQASR